MPRTALAVQQIVRGGLAPVYGAANAAGHSYPNSGREFVHVKTIGTPCNVTIITPGTVDGQAVADRVVALLANSEAMIGPFPPDAYNQPTGDGVYLDFSAVTAVTIGAFRP